jgi:U3 small nucleolar RNA-associated protein 15
MEPGTYKKLQIKAFPARAQRETAEGKYWRAFKAPTVISQVFAYCGASNPAA